MSLFKKWVRHEERPEPLEMTLDHDGRNWTVSGGDICITAPSLDGIDRKLEIAFRHKLQTGDPVHIFMCCNNEMIPMWMRPYMNHYFNRILELPLRHPA